jgi:hypothetical protein
LEGYGTVSIMKALLSGLLFVPAVFLLPSVQAATAQDIPSRMNDVAKVLNGARLVVESPASANYTHLVKTYSHVTSEGCILKYVETADESGKIVEGKSQTRHSAYSFIIDLTQAAGPAKDPLTRGQKSDHLYYSVPLVFESEQSIKQEISLNGGETASALLKHTTASFEVEGQDRALKLQEALNVAIQACAAK